jgi:iron complex transport system ATP-binding protein
MNQTLLAASGVSHAFAATPVLTSVDLALRPGQLLLVVGPNGSGKTTLVRILAGVLAARSGEIELAERPLSTYSRREVARRLAVVPQEMLVPFPYRVREMVAMGRAPFLGALGREGPRDREVVEAALASLGLTPLAERTFPTLSGGEKQRVVLARALAQESPLLLLDEPTAHMDLGHRVHTFEWLRAWIAAKPLERGVLLVTHDLLLAVRFADAVVLLDRGRVVAQGEPFEVLTSERIGAVYGVDTTVTEDEEGRPLVVAVRSRIRYPEPSDGANL